MGLTFLDYFFGFFNSLFFNSLTPYSAWFLIRQASYLLRKAPQDGQKVLGFQMKRKIDRNILRARFGYF